MWGGKIEQVLSQSARTFGQRHMSLLLVSEDNLILARGPDRASHCW